MTNIQQATKFKNLGNSSFQSGNFQQAVDQFTKAIELNPTDHVYYSNRSGAYASLNKFEEALSDANKCIEIKPDWGKGYSRKGLAEYKLGEQEKALQTYKKGLEFDPNNQQLKEGIKQVEASLKEDFDMGGMGNIMNNPQALQMLMKLMNDPETKDLMNDPSMFQTLQLAMANPAILTQLAQKDPRIQKILNVISKPASAEEKNFEDILKNAQKKSSEEHEKPKPAPKKEEKPKEPEKQLTQADKFKTQGNAEFSKKNFDKAIQFYNQAIEADPNEPLYFGNKAACLIEQEKYTEALEVIDQAVELFNNGTSKDYVKKAKIFHRRGTILARLKNYDEAIQMYDKSLVEDYKQNVKDDLAKLKKTKKEEEDKAYVDPAIAEEHCKAGNDLFKGGKYPESVKEYQEAIKRNPGVAKYYANIAASYIKLMEFVYARDQLDKALAIDPNYAKAYQRKGDCHFALKQYHKALEAYQKGLKLQPENKICSEGITKTRSAIFNSSSEADSEERARHAMADPEIQKILQSPEIRTVMNEIQSNPAAASKAFQNPDIAAKLTKLIEAGIIRTG